MKTIPTVEIPVIEEAFSVRDSPIMVCMHYANRTDARVMRDATALVEAGFNVTIVDFESDRTRPAEEDIGGVHLKHIFMPSYFVSARFKPWFLVKLVMGMIYGAVQLLRVQADIYHAHVERALPACYIAARIRGKPFIVDTPELVLSDPSYARWPRLNRLARRIIKHMVSYCAGYITASPLYPEELAKLYGAKGVTFIRNVPPYKAVTKSNRLHRHLGLDTHVRIALYQGYLQPNRGLHLLVQAAPFLESDTVIVMLGQGFKETPTQLQTLITNEGVADRVKILPPVPYEELLDWTASADIGLAVFPPDYSLSIQKCLPNKFFEYLMAGLPVISTKLDAIAEAIGTYDVGKVVPSLAPEDLVAAINEMLADHDGLARMSANALAVARLEFYWEKESQKLIHLYGEVLAKQKEFTS
jgi:glycosyltransferase involved in cell wall biosynthesis